ncbi:MAG TPA: zf-HC2 domain-containing protein, partial [Kofleriaceae bacterium]|nr:zf-HC2 domain-containing protein [Kofleriaceae bacterium]
MSAAEPAPACAHLERTYAFADGELAGDTAEAARDHLATCAVCQAELAELLQLDAAVAERAVAEAHRQAGVTSLAWYRRRSAHLATAALAAAAAVVVIVALRSNRETGVGPGPLGTGPAVTVALAPHRLIEARVAWPGAAAHRPYDPPRASEPPHEAIALMAIAQVDQRGDAHGVGVLELLNGERRQAATYLERAGGDRPELLADRAALALADHQPERALSLSDAALAVAPALGAAQWNRALALRDLGLSRTAAAAFRSVASLGEPGWADEATARAKSLDLDAARS